MGIITFITDTFSQIFSVLLGIKIFDIPVVVLLFVCTVLTFLFSHFRG